MVAQSPIGAAWITYLIISPNSPFANQDEAERKVELSKEQVGDLEEDAISAAADSLAAITASSPRSLQEFDALQVWRILSCSNDLH